MRKTRQVRKKEESDKKKVRTFKPTDLVIPIISLIVLFLLTIFVYIPLVRGTVEMRREREDISQKFSDLTEFNNQIDQIDSSGLQSTYDISLVVVPPSLDVSDFAYYIDSLAQEKGLEFSEISAGDVNVVQMSASEITVPNVSGVTGPLVYEGTYDQITDFVDDLQGSSPYIISSDDIKIFRSIEATGDQSSWVIEITVTGYYIEENQDEIDFNLYQRFTPFSIYSDVIEVFETKAAKVK